MDRYICIHGHFYQPPRENPWLEAIEVQDSAYPYHDWNERITAECYGPNAFSRILDGEGYIARIVNNYSRISFNFGPTLLAWLEDKTPDVYRAIQQADRRSRKLYSGHGSALAQVYNHMIMPLADRRDKYTQVRWGLADFEHRFGRKPEGMWLAETAVDLETLDILAEHGLRFTILSPYQAGEIRKRGGRRWHDARHGRIDPTTPYEQSLPSGRSMALFFYDGPISRAIAFERLLERGEDFANRLMGAFSSGRDWPQLVHIATDGETYGHHHRHGDMALAYALQHIEDDPSVRLTNYGEYLERYPRMPHVQIVENTAWSCVHGVERWQSNCGCNTGRGDWSQQWRGPLREALDWLRERLVPLYERAAGEIFHDPWAARDDYITVILDRSPESVTAFFQRNAGRELAGDERVRALMLLEMQRHAMLMYTSCGWFFDELSGIETVQVMQYAGRAVQLAQILFGDGDMEEGFLQRLEAARSNLLEHGDGRRIYERSVKPAQVDLKKVASHYAASSLFEDYDDETTIFCYRVARQDYQTVEGGRSRLATGRGRVTSIVTGKSVELSFACLHLGDHNLLGGVRDYTGEEDQRSMVQSLKEAMDTADVPLAVRRLDRIFGGELYSLKTLFRDEQRKILDQILESTLEDVEAVYRGQYEQYAPLMQFLSDLGTPAPRAFRSAAEVVLNADLRRALADPLQNAETIRDLLQRSASWNAQLDLAGLGYELEKHINVGVEALQKQPGDESSLAALEGLVGLANSTPFHVDLAHAQNMYYELLRRVMTEGLAPSALPPEHRPAWVHRLTTLGEQLSIRIAP